MEHICPGCGKPFELPGYFAKCLEESAEKQVPPKLEFCSPACATTHGMVVEELRRRLRIIREEGEGIRISFITP